MGLSAFRACAWAGVAVLGLVAGGVLAGPTASCMRITFPGYVGRAETLTNFPALVVLSNNVNGSGFDYGSFASTNGWDLRFVSRLGDAGSLNYDIDCWDTAGVSRVWVQVPSIPGDGSGVAWATWGDVNDAVRLPCTTNGAAWTNGYLAVWHMAEPGGALVDSAVAQGENSCYDAGTNGVVRGMDVVDGMVGKGISFEGYGQLAITNDTQLTGLTNVTVSLWYFKRSQGASAGGARMLGSGSSTYGFAHLAVSNATDSLVVRGSGTNAIYDVTGPLTNGAWHYLDYVFDDGANVLKGFRDGHLSGAVSVPTDSWMPHQYMVGYADQTNKAPDGILDEVRIANVCRSTNWVWAEYMNMASNALFGSGEGVIVEGVTDADGDGMADSWEWRRLGGTNAAPDGHADADGVDNLHEYIAGTEPTNSASYLRIMDVAAAAGAGQCVLSWASVTGKTYRVGAATSLVSGFSALGGIFTASPPVNVHTDGTAGANQKFYRIEVQ